MEKPPVQHCFDPVVDSDTRLILLGSLPGARSLAQGQYYAHPRNQFWKLIGAVIGRDLVSLPYARRLAVLLGSGIGLWDTVEAARRPGSLDADIRMETASDLRALADQAPRLQALAFNGGTAARIGRRQIGSGRGSGFEGIDLVDLPSSSPAFTLPFDRKMEQWIRLRLYLSGIE